MRKNRFDGSFSFFGFYFNQDGMIDDSEDDILVWDSQTVSADDLSEESSLMKDDIKESDTDDVDTTIVGSDKKKTENCIEDIEDSGNSVYEKKYYKNTYNYSFIFSTFLSYTPSNKYSQYGILDISAYDIHYIFCYRIY